MNILLQFKLGICSVFWLGCLRVLLPCTSVISSGESVHISTPHVQVAALAGDKISVTYWIFSFSFFFGQKLCHCQRKVGRLRPLWPACSAHPETASIIPSGNFSWNTGSSSIGSALPHVLFHHIPPYSVLWSILWRAQQRYSNLKAMCRYEPVNNIQKRWLRNLQLSESRFAKLDRDAHLWPYHPANTLMCRLWKTDLERATGVHSAFHPLPTLSWTNGFQNDYGIPTINLVSEGVIQKWKVQQIQLFE